ncbi:MAG: radical SAM protein, partial [Polyangia bacterium]|nr:radical SAM protein [Polyangia bacterium]
MSGQSTKSPLCTRRGLPKTTPRFKTLHIATGFRCNNACVFCCDSHDARPPRPDLQVARRSLEENAELGFVVFTHLEPTLNPDLVTLVGWAKELRYETIMLVTNGRRLGKRGLAERLVEAGMNCVAISIHGHNAELHDTITQRKGSFAEVLAGVGAIQGLRRVHDLEFKVLTTLSALNYEHISEIADFVGGMGVDSHGLNAVYLEGEASRNREVVAVPYEAMVAAFAEAIKVEPTRDITLSEIPPCLTAGRLPARNIGFREEFHFPILDEQGRLLDSAKALAPAGRGFAFQPSCDLCAMRAMCDGVPEAYVEQCGWAGFSPLTESQREALIVPEEREKPLPFVPEAVLRV